jgi:hypothetical protein
MLTDLFSRAPLRLSEVHFHDARHILATRSWCMLRNAGYDPLPRLKDYLQSDIVAKRFGLLMEVVTAVWPEPFAIHRPCCASLSLDEGLLVRAIDLAAANARPQFDELLREMLSDDARNMLFIRARFLYPVSY